MRCTDHSTPRTQFLELLVNFFINMDDPWAAVSQDDIVVFGSLWGTLLGPLGLYKCTWQHNSTSYSFHFHSDSTDVKQCCTCWVVFVVFLFLVLVVFSVVFFFFSEMVPLVSLLLCFNTLYWKDSVGWKCAAKTCITWVWK